MTTAQETYENAPAVPAVGIPLDRPVRPLVERLRACEQGLNLGADGMGWSPDPALLKEAADEIERLRRVWEDTRSQRDELLAHIAGKAPLPQWASDWLKA